MKSYLKWVEWECAPLPRHEDMGEHKRQSWMRHQVRYKDVKNDHTSSGTQVQGHVSEQLLGGVAHEL